MTDSLNILMLVTALTALVLLCWQDPCRHKKAHRKILSRFILLRQSRHRAMLWFIIAVPLLVYAVRGNSSDLMIALAIYSLSGWLLTKLFVIHKG